MERIKLPAGTKQNLSTVFETLQNNEKTNLKRRFIQLIGEYGIDATRVNGAVTSNELQVTSVDTNTLAVAPGTALTESFNYIRSLTTTTIDLSGYSAGNYTILAVANNYEDTPVPVINGFLYDSGNSTINTRIHSSVDFQVLASGSTPNVSGLYLANITWTGSAPATVYDRRSENILSLNDNIIDDSVVVKKDRNSEIAGIITFNENTGFGGKTSPEYEADVTGDIRSTGTIFTDTLSPNSANNITIKPKVTGGKVVIKLHDSTGRIDIQDETGTVVGYITKTGIYFNKPVTFSDTVNVGDLAAIGDIVFPDGDHITLEGVQNTEFRLGVGSLNSGAGVKVLTEDLNPSNPINFRIYDLKPTNNKDESALYMVLKWNYDYILGSNEGDSTFTVDPSTTLNHTEAQIAGKYLMFPSGNKYFILDWDNTGKVLTLENMPSGEPDPTAQNPCKIIDLATGYILSILCSDSIDPQGDRYAETLKYNLDLDEVNTPIFQTKIPAKRYTWFNLRSVNGNKKGSTVYMQAGSYDPDHAAGGQDPVSYTIPFYTQLPNLDSSGASVSCESSNYGFYINIAGWSGGEDPFDPDQEAHEFEYGYTRNTGMLGTDDEGVPNWDWTSSGVSRFTTVNRAIPVNTTQSGQYAVGVRALQNKQVVSSTLVTSVNSGGGGIPPLSTLQISKEFNISAFDGAASGKSADATIPILILTGVTWTGVAPEYGTLSGKKVYFDSPVGGVDGLVIHSYYNAGSASNIVLNDEHLTSDLPATPINFTLGTSQLGRRFLSTNLSKDTKLTYIHVEVYSALGVSADNPGVLRVYQSTQSSAFGSLDIPISSGIVSGNIDVNITYAQGSNRTLIIDLWDADASAPNNTCSIIGRVDLYGEPITTNTNNTNTGGGAN